MEEVPTRMRRQEDTIDDPRSDRGGRCLLVADRALPSGELCRILTDRYSSHRTDIHVQISRIRRPVLEPDPALVPSPARRSDQAIAVADQRYGVAEARLESFMRALRDVAATLSGEVVRSSPVRAARRAIRSGAFDEILVVTGARNRPWFRRDLVARLRRASGLPVTPIDTVDLVAGPRIDAGADCRDHGWRPTPISGEEDGWPGSTRYRERS